MEIFDPDKPQAAGTVIELPPEPKDVRIVGMRALEGPFVVVAVTHVHGVFTFRLPPERGEKMGAAISSASRQAESGLVIIGDAEGL